MEKVGEIIWCKESYATYCFGSKLAGKYEMIYFSICPY